MLPRLLRILKSLAVGVACGAAITVLIVPGTIQFLAWLQGSPVASNLLRIAFVLGLALFCLLFAGRPLLYEGLSSVLLMAGVLLVVWSIPALAIYWTAHADKPKRAIQIACFLFACGFAILFYLKNKDKFPNPDQKVTFFSGVILTPPAVVEILL